MAKEKKPISKALKTFMASEIWDLTGCPVSRLTTTHIS